MKGLKSQTYVLPHSDFQSQSVQSRTRFKPFIYKFLKKEIERFKQNQDGFHNKIEFTSLIDSA